MGWYPDVHTQSGHIVASSGSGPAEIGAAVSRPAVRSTPKPAEVEHLLSTVDWYSYQESLVDAVKDAAASYCSLFSVTCAELVFQVAVVTDPRTRITAISFETIRHAREMIKLRRQSTGHPYNDDPEDFKYTEFYLALHDELRPLKDLDFWHQIPLRHAMTRIRRSAELAIDRILDERILHALPREEVVWVGTSSHEAPFDGVRHL